MTTSTTAGIREASGPLAHDARYLIRVPPNWNGVLLNDVDYANAPEDSPAQTFLLQRGYALSGSSRLQTKWPENLVNQLSVLEIFQKDFETPKRTIQIGCSGGGYTSLSMAEMHPDRVDGTIPLCGASSVMLRNLWLDLLFALKALIAPDGDLTVVVPLSEVTDGPQFDDSRAKPWMDALDAAQATPIGRARIALGVTLAQWPTWSGTAPIDLPKPDRDDVDAAQRAMLETARAGVGIGMAFVSDSSGRFFSNVGVNYAQYYGSADRAQKGIVRALYRAANVDPDRALRDDLRRINETDRVAGEPHAFKDPHARPHTGRPGVPTLHVTTMDAAVPPVVMRGYDARIRSQGKARLYRQAFVDRANHCGFSISEKAAVVETMMARLDTGSWGDRTRPDRLNELAAGFGVDESKFIAYTPPRMNRAVFADDDPAG